MSEIDGQRLEDYPDDFDLTPVALRAVAQLNHLTRELRVDVGIAPRAIAILQPLDDGSLMGVQAIGEFIACLASSMREARRHGKPAAQQRPLRGG